MRNKSAFGDVTSPSFLLIELVIALAIFSFFALAITALQVGLIKSYDLAQSRMQMLQCYSDIIECNGGVPEPISTLSITHGKHYTSLDTLNRERLHGLLGIQCRLRDITIERLEIKKKSFGYYSMSGIWVVMERVQ